MKELFDPHVSLFTVSFCCLTFIISVNVNIDAAVNENLHAVNPSVINISSSFNFLRFTLLVCGVVGCALDALVVCDTILCRCNDR